MQQNDYLRNTIFNFIFFEFENLFFIKYKKKLKIVNVCTNRQFQVDRVFWSVSAVTRQRRNNPLNAIQRDERYFESSRSSMVLESHKRLTITWNFDSCLSAWFDLKTKFKNNKIKMQNENSFNMFKFECKILIFEKEKIINVRLA